MRSPDDQSGSVDAVAASGKQGSTLTSRVTDLVPLIAELASQTECNRRVSDEVIEALRVAGMWRAYVPREFGGSEESILEVVRCIRIIAQACASTAWVTAVLCAHPFIAGLYSRQLQEEFWSGGPDTLASSSILPLDRATFADGGLRISGQFPFSSGAVNAAWAMVAVSTPQGTSSDADSSGAPFLCVVPRSDYQVKDNWHAMGLAGTASCDLVFEDVYVPAYRIKSLREILGRYGREEGIRTGRLWNAGFDATVGTALTPVFLGIADAILEQVQQKIQARAVSGAIPPARSASSAMRIGESTLELRACTLIWEDYVRQVEDRAAAGSVPDEDFGAYGSAVTIHAQEMATRTIDRLFAVAGGSSIRLQSPIQRMWRDAHAGRSHIAHEYDPAVQAFGCHLLGLPVARIVR